MLRICPPLGQVYSSVAIPAAAAAAYPGQIPVQAGGMPTIAKVGIAAALIGAAAVVAKRLKMKRSR